MQLLELPSVRLYAAPGHLPWPREHATCAAALPAQHWIKKKTGYSPASSASASGAITALPASVIV